MSRPLLSLGVLLVTPLLGQPAAAQQRDLQRIDDEIAALAVKLKALTDHNLADATVRGGRSFDARLSDAEVMFILGDYGRAALILYEMVREPGARDQPHYDKLLRYLAESFFQLENDRLATQYFTEVLGRPDASYTNDAARRLIEIADRQQDWSSLAPMITALRQRNALTPDVAYRYARSLLMRGRAEDALHIAAAMPAAHPLYLKGSYLQAVAHLEMGDVDQARDIFEQLSKAAANPNTLYDDAAQVHDLAALDLGRLLIEQGHYERALEQYQAIEHTSGKFEDALYELTWIYVRAAGQPGNDQSRFLAYNQALDRLEILLLEPSNAALVPDASLLLGNVLLNLGRYQAAEQAFVDVVNRYSPMRETLDSVQRATADLAHVFLPVLRAAKQGESTAFMDSETLMLPPLATLYAQDEQGLQRAVSITHDLDDSTASLTEADALLQKIASSIELQKNARFSYALQGIRNRALELQNALMGITERLLAVQRQLTAPLLAPEQVRELEAVGQQRARLEPHYRALPQRHEDYEERDSAVKNVLGRMQRDAFRIKFAIEEQQQQIAALLTWYGEHPQLLDAAHAEQFQARLTRESSALRELEDVRHQLNSEIDTQRSMSGVMSTEQAQEEALRTDYAVLLERERELLNRGAAAAGGQARALLDKVEADRATLASYRALLEVFGKSMATAINAEMQRSQADVGALQMALNSEHQTLQAIRHDATDAVEAVAKVAMHDIRGKLYDVVLRGDVGIVDVAWARKEEQTHAVNRQVSAQHQEMQNLDNEFKDVMTKD